MKIPHNPTWLHPKPVFIFDLRNHKKSYTNPSIIQKHFTELKSHYPDHSAIYTDGSKDGDKVASAAVFLPFLPYLVQKRKLSFLH